MAVSYTITNPAALMKIEPLSFPRVIKTALGAVRVYRGQNGEKIEHVVHWSVAGQRKREKFADAGRAVARAEEVAADLNKGRLERASMSPADIAEFRAAKVLLAGSSLLKAAEFFVESNAGVSQKTVKEACDHHYSELSISGSDRHKTSTKSKHLFITQEFGSRIISSITRDEIVYFLKTACCRPKHFRGRALSGKSRNNLANTFTAVWNHAQARMGAMPKNIPHAAMELPTFEENQEKSVYTPEELGKLLEYTRLKTLSGEIPKWVLAALAIKAFTGIRTAELERLQWEDVRVESQSILLHRGLTKTKEGRRLPIRPALAEWLALCSKSSGRITEGSFFDYTRTIATGALGGGAKWGHNALRHSFISYAMAECGNAALVSDQSGNSIRMIKAVYQTLAVPEDACKYFNLSPKGVA